MFWQHLDAGQQTAGKILDIFFISSWVGLRVKRSVLLVLFAVSGFGVLLCSPFHVFFCGAFVFFQDDVSKLKLPRFMPGSMFEIQSYKEPHCTGQNNTKLFLGENCVYVVVCKGFCGIWMVSFAFLPEVPSFCLQYLSGRFKVVVFENVYL